MPRVARIKSYTNMYHTILRGIDQRNIFYDEQDRKKFIQELIKTKEKYKYDIYAYCLMNNHIHLLVNDYENNLCKIMQKIALSYSIYFNKKYERIGHLFQNRYISKPVENIRYLCSLQKYIHQNPQNEGICKTEEYKWSSYKDYKGRDGITETKYLLSIYGNLEEFERFTLQRLNNDIKDFLEYELKTKITDDEAKVIISEIVDIKEIQRLNTYERNKEIQKLIDIKGISLSQMSRILGINRKVIERIFKIRSVPNWTKCPIEKRPQMDKEV